MAGPDDDEEIKLPVEDEAEGDAGPDDDQSGDASEAGQEPEDAEAEEGEVIDAKPSRATRRVQELRRIAQEANDDRARLRREIEELRAQRAQLQSPPQESEEQEQARLALMTREDQADYKLQKATRHFERMMNLTRFQAADLADKASYDSKSAYDPRFKKYAKEVDELLMQERRAGRDFPRETILSFYLGQKVLKSETREAAAKAGKDRVKAQTTRPAEGRSDHAAPRERVGQGNNLRDLERRLEGRFI